MLNNVYNSHWNYVLRKLLHIDKNVTASDHTSTYSVHCEWSVSSLSKHQKTSITTWLCLCTSFNNIMCKMLQGLTGTVHRRRTKQHYKAHNVHCCTAQNRTEVSSKVLHMHCKGSHFVSKGVEWKWDKINAIMCVCDIGTASTRESSSVQRSQWEPCRGLHRLTPLSQTDLCTRRVLFNCTDLC